MVWQLDPAAAAPRERSRYAAPEPPHQQSYELRRSTPQELVARERARSELPSLRAALDAAGWDTQQLDQLEQAQARVVFHE